MSAVEHTHAGNFLSLTYEHTEMEAETDKLARCGVDKLTKSRHCACACAYVHVVGVVGK